MTSPGRDRYVDVYASTGDREAEWLLRTSAQKVESIKQLAGPLHPGSILEVGCGSGAVIGGLRRVGFGSSHFGVDYSSDALAILQQSSPGVRVARTDITEEPDPFHAGPYDLVVASHVVEHLEEPHVFLRALRHVPHRFLIVEVPLEANPLHRVMGLVRDPMRNAAGHVQFFDRRSLHALMADCGYQVLGERIYAPIVDADTRRFMYGDQTRIRRVHKLMTEDVLPRRLGRAWTRLYHAHMAVLCTQPSAAA